ncbi:MAG: hypothetical protein AAF065_02350 [Verrucomicrobiota bacterium]
MKTLNFDLPTGLWKIRASTGFIFLTGLVLAFSVSGQEKVVESVPDINAQKKVLRPVASDAASQQLVDNFLTVTGGTEAYQNLRNVVASGTLREASQHKQFELVESQDGKRYLRLIWQFRGRSYEHIQAYDGETVWKRETKPKLLDPEESDSLEGIHFSNHRWLVQPLVQPSISDFTFEYQGEARVGIRKCHIVIGFGKEDERTWFYFDQETFLLLRWGGYSEIAGVQEYVDYRASKFKRVGGVLLPTSIDLIAENSPYGEVVFEKIETNQPIDLSLFLMPAGNSPILRQNPMPEN